MKKTTEQKARYIVEQNKVSLTEGDHNLFFMVAGISIVYDKYEGRWLCSCKHHSIKPNGSKCCFIRAAEIYLEEEIENDNN